MINTVYFEKGSNFANVYNLYQWDYGQSLEIKGLDINGDVWVQFAMNPYGGKAIPVVTKVNDGVITANIPAFVFEKETMQNYNAYAFVYVSNVDSGETVKVIKLNIKARPKPEDYVYTEPEKQRYEILEKLIKSFLNSNGEIDPKKIPDMYYKEDGLVNTIKEEYLGLDWVPKIRVNNVEIFKEQEITVTNENNVGNEELYLYDLGIDQDTRKKIINEYDSLTLVLDGNKIELPYVERLEEDGYVYEAIFTINPFNQQGTSYEGTVLVGAGKNATMQVALTLGEHTLEVRHINVTPNPLPAELLTDGTPYLEKTFSEILPEMTGTTSELYNGQIELPIGLELFEGDEYNVKWQGKEYDCICYSVEIENTKINILGDVYTLSGGEVGKEATGEPFCFFIYPKELQGVINASGGCTPVPPVINETFTFSIDGYKKKLRKLPEKCMPESMFKNTKLGDTLMWDGNTDGLELIDTKYGTVCCVSSVVPSLEDLKQGLLQEITKSISDVNAYYGSTFITYNKVIQVNLFKGSGLAILFVLEDNVEYYGTTFSKQGTYFRIWDDKYLSRIKVPSFTGYNTNVQTIQEYCLPKDVESIVVRSSTEGSTKKFKLTVDDSGTITATEIVE